MTKTTKKLFVSIAVLVLAIALAATTTFAWFTVNKKVTVGNVDVNVTTEADGLYISADGTEFAETVNIEGIVAELDAITTADGKSFTDEKGTVVAAYNADAADAKANKYVEFKLYFRSSTAHTVKFTGCAVTSEDPAPTVSAPKAWDALTESDYGATLAKGDTLATRAANAARVSFTSGDTTKVWNPNSTSEFNANSAARNLAQDYKAQLLGQNLPTDIAKPATDDKAITTLDNTDAITLALDANGVYYVGEITVRLWIDGQDADCLNTILSDNVRLALAFMVPENN